MKTPSTNQSRRRGATAVELALTLPILFMFLFATYEFGRANMMMHTVEAAAYEGARVGIVPGATQAETVAAARGVLGTAGIREATITVTPNNLSQDTETISVEISFRFKDNSIMAPLFMGDGSMTRVCEMNREKL